MQFTPRERVSLFLAALTGSGQHLKGIVLTREEALEKYRAPTPTNSSSSAPPVTGNEEAFTWDSWQAKAKTEQEERENGLHTLAVYRPEQWMEGRPWQFGIPTDGDEVEWSCRYEDAEDC